MIAGDIACKVLLVMVAILRRLVCYFKMLLRPNSSDRDKPTSCQHRRQHYDNELRRWSVRGQSACLLLCLLNIVNNYNILLRRDHLSDDKGRVAT